MVEILFWFHDTNFNQCWCCHLTSLQHGQPVWLAVWLVTDFCISIDASVHMYHRLMTVILIFLEGGWQPESWFKPQPHKTRTIPIIQSLFLAHRKLSTVSCDFTYCFFFFKFGALINFPACASVGWIPMDRTNGFYFLGRKHGNCKAVHIVYSIDRNQQQTSHWALIIAIANIVEL